MVLFSSSVHFAESKENGQRPPPQAFFLPRDPRDCVLSVALMGQDLAGPRDP